MLEFEKTYPTLRMYFNRRSDLSWSVDDGDQSNELNAPSIITQGVALWKYNGQKTNPDTPVAWVEMHQARVHRIDDSDELFVENSSE